MASTGINWLEIMILKQVQTNHTFVAQGLSTFQAHSGKPLAPGIESIYLIYI